MATESVLHKRDANVKCYNVLRDDLFTDSSRAIRYYVIRNKSHETDTTRSRDDGTRMISRYHFDST